MSIQTSGRYFFNDHAPMFAGPHIYWHRQWANQNHPSEIVPGPVLDAPWQFVQGQWPIAFPRQRVVGSGDCIGNGETAPPVDASTLVEGLPQGCFGEPQPGDEDWSVKPPVYDPNIFSPPWRVIQQIMGEPFVEGPFLPVDENRWWPLSNYQSGATQKFWMKMIQLVYFDQKGLIDQIVDLTWPTWNRRQYIAHTPGQVGSYIIDAADGTYVVMDGTHDPLSKDLIDQILSFGVPLDPSAPYAVTPVYAANAAVVEIRRFVMGGTPPKRIFFTGHSMGGAVAMVLAIRIKLVNPDWDVRWLAFGAPKCGNDKAMDLLRFCQGVHIVGDNDVIPQLPPEWTDPGVWALGLGVVGLLMWNDYKRAKTQWIIDQNGERVLPNLFSWAVQTISGPLTTALVQVVRWALLGGPAPIIGSHEITEYLRRIQVRHPANEYPDTDAVERIYNTLQLEGQAAGQLEGIPDGQAEITLAGIAADGQRESDMGAIDGQAESERHIPVDGQALGELPGIADGQAEQDWFTLAADGQAQRVLPGVADGELQGDLVGLEGQAERDLDESPIATACCVAGIPATLTIRVTSPAGASHYAPLDGTQGTLFFSSGVSAWRGIVTDHNGVDWNFDFFCQAPNWALAFSSVVSPAGGLGLAASTCVLPIGGLGSTFFLLPFGLGNIVCTVDEF